MWKKTTGRASTFTTEKVNQEIRLERQCGYVRARSCMLSKKNFEKTKKKDGTGNGHFIQNKCPIHDIQPARHHHRYDCGQFYRFYILLLQLNHNFVISDIILKTEIKRMRKQDA